jgi:thiosulfate dehydrogenase [quinone] large subunit
LIVPKSWDLIDFIDWSTRWFLLIVGVLLMVGLFTRLSCFAAAVFLAMTILTQPSVPWLPAPPVSEGNYLFVNKNVIEMVALLALMTTRSGKWAGLDAIVSALFGRRRRDRAARY